MNPILRKCLILFFSGLIAFTALYFCFINPFSIIPNRGLERVIRQQIGKPTGAITPEDCMGIKVLDLSLSDFNTNLDGLQYFVDLEELDSSGGFLSDISALSGLTKLKIIFLDQDCIKDLTPLKGLVNLEELYLHDNNIRDLSPLSSLTNLKILSIGENPVAWEQHYQPLSIIYGLRIITYCDDNGAVIEAPSEPE